MCGWDAIRFCFFFAFNLPSRRIVRGRNKVATSDLSCKFSMVQMVQITRDNYKAMQVCLQLTGDKANANFFHHHRLNETIRQTINNYTYNPNSPAATATAAPIIARIANSLAMNMFRLNAETQRGF